VESAEIETLVNELETRVDRLRALYEQYFMGIERMPPSVPHKDVERRIQTLRKEQIRNTGVRFRFQMIIQRYNVYQSHWQRICRQIEEGTYKRDLLRAQRRAKPVEAEIASQPPPAPVPEPKVRMEPKVEMPEEAPTKKVALADIDALDELKLDDFADLDRVLNAPVEHLPVPPKPAAPAAPRPQWRKIEKPAAAPAPPAPAPQPKPAVAAPPAPQPKPGPPPVPKKPPPPVPTAAKPAAPPTPVAQKPAAAPPPAPPRSPADLTDDRMRQLYSQYVQTRRAQNESTAAITYDAMAKSLRESSAKLREKHGKAVDFEVTVKDGKTVLKPVVKPK
jgi:hypothetical protein